jgi:hypothetical protein
MWVSKIAAGHAPVPNSGDRPAQPMDSPPEPRPGTALPSLVALGQDRPDVSGTAFVAPGAVLIGRVTIGAEASPAR